MHILKISGIQKSIEISINMTIRISFCWITPATPNFGHPNPLPRLPDSDLDASTDEKMIANDTKIWVFPKKGVPKMDGL